MCVCRYGNLFPDAKGRPMARGEVICGRVAARGDVKPPAGTSALVTTLISVFIDNVRASLGGTIGPVSEARRDTQKLSHIKR